MEHEKTVQNLAVECYLLGEMAPEEREAFEEHYFECSVCAEDLRAASQFIEDAKDILAAGREFPAYQREPEPVRTRWNWLAWLQPQFAGAAIAVLLVVAGVQNFGTIPGLRKQVREGDVPRALPTTVLLAQTRSSMPTLKAGPGGSLSLQIDVPETTASSLQFIVQSTAGQEVLHSSGDVPAPGKSVNFFIPKLDAPDGTYTLVVKTGDSGGLKLAEYPFRLEHR